MSAWVSNPSHSDIALSSILRVVSSPDFVSADCAPTVYLANKVIEKHCEVGTNKYRLSSGNLASIVNVESLIRSELKKDKVGRYLKWKHEKVDTPS